MTFEAVVQMLNVIRVVWPKFLQGAGDAEAEIAARAWYAVLRNEPEELVQAALEDCQRSSPYPPVPADLCTRIAAMRQADEITAEEAFELLRKAARNGIYHAREEFDKLPMECRRFLGSSSALRDLAMVDEDQISTVTRGQFLRRFESIRQNEALRLNMPAPLRALIRQSVKSLPGAVEREDQEDGEE